jgi:hypothetical protein
MTLRAVQGAQQGGFDPRAKLRGEWTEHAAMLGGQVRDGITLCLEHVVVEDHPPRRTDSASGCMARGYAEGAL